MSPLVEALLITFAGVVAAALLTFIGWLARFFWKHNEAEVEARTEFREKLVAHAEAVEVSQTELTGRIERFSDRQDIAHAGVDDELSGLSSEVGGLRTCFQNGIGNLRERVAVLEDRE